MRPIDTTISTIRGHFDVNGNYIPAGNYYYRIKDYNNGNFVGNIRNKGEFILSPKSLVKMMAVGQSRLAEKANLLDEPGMPNYPIPDRYSGMRIRRRNTSIFRSSGNIVIAPPSRGIISWGSRSTRNTRIVAPAPTITTPEASHECTICLQNTNILTSKILRCGHKFHSSCIKEWFKEDNIKKRCPLCRSNNEGKDNESDNNDNDPLRDAITRLREDFSDERNRILSRHK